MVTVYGDRQTEETPLCTKLGGDLSLGAGPRLGRNLGLKSLRVYVDLNLGKGQTVGRDQGLGGGPKLENDQRLGRSPTLKKDLCLGKKTQD